MAINPIPPVSYPINYLKNTKAPANVTPLDRGETLRSGTVSSDKLVIGIQNINKNSHKMIEGAGEKKLYI